MANTDTIRTNYERMQNGVPTETLPRLTHNLKTTTNNIGASIEGFATGLVFPILMCAPMAVAASITGKDFFREEIREYNTQKGYSQQMAKISDVAYVVGRTITQLGAAAYILFE